MIKTETVVDMLSRVKDLIAKGVSRAQLIVMLEQVIQAVQEEEEE